MSHKDLLQPQGSTVEKENLATEIVSCLAAVSQRFLSASREYFFFSRCNEADLMTKAGAYVS